MGTFIQSWLRGHSRRARIFGAGLIFVSTIAAGLVISMQQASAASANQSLAISLINKCGFGSKEPGVGLWSKGTQWSDLVWVWNYESGWNNYAQNPGPGHAYGIPQALGHGPGGAEYPTWTSTCGANQYTKLANPSRYGGTSSAKYQILWGLLYIRQVYYDPAGAYRHEKAYGWY